MSEVQRNIKLNLDVDDALKQVAKLRQELESIAAEASGGILDDDAIKSSADRASSSFNKLKQVGSYSLEAIKGAAIGVSTAIAGVGVGIASMISGFSDLSHGLRSVLQANASSEFDSQAKSISSATRNMISYSDALQAARLSEAVGLSDKQLSTLSAYAAELALTSETGIEANDVLKEMFKNINDGSIGGVLGDISPELKRQVDDWKQVNSGVDLATQRSAVLKMVMSNAMQSINGQTSVLNSSLGRMFGITNQINNALEETGGLFSGIGKILLGVVAPAIAGLSAFLIGGPIAGLVGSLVGGGLTIAATGLVAGAARSGLSQDQKKGPSAIDSASDLVQNFLGAFVSGIANDKVAVGTIKQSSIEFFERLFGVPFTEARTTIANIGKSLGDFGEDFIKGIKERFPQIKKSLIDIKDSIIDIFGAIGFDFSSAESAAETLSDSFGILAESMKAISKIIEGLVYIIPGVNFIKAYNETKKSINAEQSARKTETRQIREKKEAFIESGRKPGESLKEYLSRQQTEQNVLFGIPSQEEAEASRRRGLELLGLKERRNEQSVDDALITKTGSVIRLNPNDNVLAFQNNLPAQTQGGNNDAVVQKLEQVVQAITTIQRQMGESLRFTQQLNLKKEAMVQ